MTSAPSPNGQSPDAVREAVARTWNEIRSRYVIYCTFMGNTPAKLWLDKESATEPFFVGPIDDCEAAIDRASADAIIAEHIAPLLAQRDAAIARAVEAERQATDLRGYLERANNSSRYWEYIHGEKQKRLDTANVRASTLTADLAQAKAQVAGMRDKANELREAAGYLVYRYQRIGRGKPVRDLPEAEAHFASAAGAFDRALTLTEAPHDD